MNVQLKLTENGRGAFVVEENNKTIARMDVAISNDIVTVYHTEVDDRLAGKGVAKQLMDTMTAYARTNHKKVIPLCSFVATQFKKRSEQYADVWKKDWHQ